MPRNYNKKGKLGLESTSDNSELVVASSIGLLTVSYSQGIGASQTVDIAQSFRPIIEFRRNGIHGSNIILTAIPPSTFYPLSTVNIFIECARVHRAKQHYWSAESLNSALSEGKFYD